MVREWWPFISMPIMAVTVTINHRLHKVPAIKCLMSFSCNVCLVVSLPIYITHYIVIGRSLDPMFSSTNVFKFIRNYTHKKEYNYARNNIISTVRYLNMGNDYRRVNVIIVLEHIPCL